MSTIAFMGDVMLGRGVNEALRGMAPQEVWGDLLPVLEGADLRIANLECAITSRGRPWTRTPKVFFFRADPEAVNVLTAARIDACSLANNHSLDFEEEGLIDTIEILDQVGIRHAGAGRTIEEARRPAILNAGPGEKVGLAAFTDNEPFFAATSDHPGTSYLPVSVDRETLGVVFAAIQEARAMGAGTVIVSNHWGPNMVERPSDPFRDFAHAVIELGADIYYGHSAHVFQGVEIYRDRPILYDTGDFIDDYAVDPIMRNDWSFLFLVTFEGGELERIDLRPVQLSTARVQQATDPEMPVMLRKMQDLSAALGTDFDEGIERLIWTRKPGAGAAGGRGGRSRRSGTRAGPPDQK